MRHDTIGVEGFINMFSTTCSYRSCGIGTFLESKALAFACGCMQRAVVIICSQPRTTSAICATVLHRGVAC